MKITQVRLGRISTPLRVPFKTALRTVNSVEDVIVELHTDTGAVGYGEAPPTGVITGDTTGAILGAIRDHIAPALLGRDLDEFEDLTAAVQKALVHNTSAKAAVDMALWDLLGQKYSAPVYRMLGGARKNIVTDITISVNPPEEMARDARTAVQRGYDCLKVKVGIDPELDVARLAAVRQAVGRDIKLRIDANQAWNAKQAVRILNQMQEKGLDIEFVEQPVPAADLEGMQYVTRHADVPVLADESVFSPADALRIMQTGAADLVNIKLMKCGGITNALRIAAAAEVYGVHDRLYAGSEDLGQRRCGAGLRQEDHHQDRPRRPGALQRGPHPRRCRVRRKEHHRLRRARHGHSGLCARQGVLSRLKQEQTASRNTRGAVSFCKSVFHIRTVKKARVCIC